MSSTGTAAADKSCDGQLIQIDHLVKTYLLGEVEVHALRGVSISVSRGSSSPSWARPVPGNPRS